jgi:hypothetical protein
MPLTKSESLEQLRATAAEVDQAITRNKLERENIKAKARAELTTNGEDAKRLAQGKQRIESLIEWWEDAPVDADYDITPLMGSNKTAIGH